MLKFSDVSKDIGNVRILGKFNLEITQGKCTCLKCKGEAGKIIIDLILGSILPSSGDILLDSMPVYNNREIIKNNFESVLSNDGIYDRLTVKEYIDFFAGLYEIKFERAKLLKLCGLLDKENIKISKLTDGEKYRVKLAKCGLRTPKVILLEKPSQNIDLESARISNSFIKAMSERGVAVIVISSSYEEILSMADEAYEVSEDGIKQIEIEVNEYGNQQDASDTNVNKSSKDQTEESASHNEIKIEKIPAKVDSKIILFNPTEISFIESNEGNTLIHVGEESFSCNLTMAELEERLKYLGFFRSHRSYIVNLQRVREVMSWSKNSYCLILNDMEKTNIPLSKGKYDELKDILHF